jgi:hypothetical protein
MDGRRTIDLDEPVSGNSSKNDVAGVTGFYGRINIFRPTSNAQKPIKAGVYGVGSGNGVQGESTSKSDSGVWGNNSNGGFGVAGTSDKPNGIGVYGRGAVLAGKFEGNVEISKNLEVGGDIFLTGADLAEDFFIVEANNVEPGTVMVIDSANTLKICNSEYDRRVAGVISGAGKYKPGIILDKQESSDNRLPIALMGKVYCKVDADYGAIEIGDLLTTSATVGHAMKAQEQLKAFGAVIGKALSPLKEGKGLIPILISLQ